MKKILSNSLFLWTLVANLCSNFGDIVYYLALMNYVLFLPKPEFALSIITLSETLPIIFQFFIGIWSDKTQNKLSMIQLTLIFRTLLYLILGWVMSFEPSLWILILAAVFNFFSDIAGKYENGLFLPVTMRIIPSEDRAEFMGFSQSVQMTCMIIFQNAGALLIAVLTYSQLALINALSFFIPFVMMRVINARLSEVMAKPSENLSGVPQAREEIEVGSWWHRTWTSFKEVFRELYVIPDVSAAMIFAPVLNGLFALIPAIMMLVMKENEAFVIQTPAVTLAIFQTLFIIGSIVGGLLVMSIFKSIRLGKVIEISLIFVLGVILSLHLQSIYGVLLFVCMTGMVGGAVNPKLNAALMNNIPEDRIARIDGVIGTYFLVGVMAMQLAFSVLVLVLKLRQMTLGLLILAIGFSVYLLSKKFQERNLSREV